MSEHPSKPVWGWAPGDSRPTRCGTFTLKPGVGEFVYAQDYLDSRGPALDPISLPTTRRIAPHKEIKQGGVFGVFRDAMPDGFGLFILEAIKERDLPHPLDRLEHSLGDAVGAIEVCDDIEAKLAYEPPRLDELLDTLKTLPDSRPSSEAARMLHHAQGTSLGGERPKMTVLHEGEMWIAKLQDRGDAPNTPLREYAAMRVGQVLGLDIADVLFRRAGDRQVVLVRRFDRTRTSHGFARKLYASAHTVLRLDGQTREDASRSYVALAKALGRWTYSQGRSSGTNPGAELWRRMAYNAICGNGDDHPRNHALLHDGRSWHLAPAFDIAPHATPSGVLSMSVNRVGDRRPTLGAILTSHADFSISKENATAFIDQARDVFAQAWADAVRGVGENPDDVPCYRWVPTPGSDGSSQKRETKATPRT